MAAAGWVFFMLGLARAAPQRYRAFLQEDRFIEWWTVTLFLAAAVIILRQALPKRRGFDLLVAAFCIFVAGEEFSWGQRLLGFTPPALFLEHNTQQELTLHNFSAVFGQPKRVLMLALFGYGILLPALKLWPRTARLLERIGCSAPPHSLAPWFACALVLLYWYPVPFTGEWVEALAGGLFLASTQPAPRRLLAAASVSALAALALTLFGARPVRPPPAPLDCTRRELDALLSDLRDGAATAKLSNGNNTVHKRVSTAIAERYLYRDRFPHFSALHCNASARQHAIDPWGMAYWMRAQTTSEGTRQIQIYSMGPNRKRDHTEERANGRSSGRATGGDDLVVTGILAR